MIGQNGASISQFPQNLFAPPVTKLPVIAQPVIPKPNIISQTTLSNIPKVTFNQPVTPIFPGLQPTQQSTLLQPTQVPGPPIQNAQVQPIVPQLSQSIFPLPQPSRTSTVSHYNLPKESLRAFPVQGTSILLPKQQTEFQPIVQPVSQPVLINPPKVAQPFPVERPTGYLSTNVTPQLNTVSNIPKPVFPIQQRQTLVVQPQQIKQTQGGGLLRQFGGGTSVIPIRETAQISATPKINIIEETGISILEKLSAAWNGTIEKINQLTALKYQNGNNIIDVARRDIITEIIGMLVSESFEYVIDFLTNAPNPEFVLWDQSSMDEGRISLARELALQQVEDVGVVGISKCRYCPSTELVFALKQLRSGDEPATIFIRCVMCGKQWRQHS